MAGIPRPLYALLYAAWWAATTVACLAARARSRLHRHPRHGPRYGFGLHPDAVHITAGVHLLHADTDGRTAYLALRASADNPVLITTAGELTAALAAWTASNPQTHPDRAAIASPRHAGAPPAPAPAPPAVR